MSQSKLQQSASNNLSQAGSSALPGITRRRFLKASAAALALSTFGGYAAEFADQKKRVGLIGCGWYGKCDLFRLIQVAPVEVVSLCDVDKNMLGRAAEIVAHTAGVEEEAAHLQRLSRDAEGEGSRHRADRRRPIIGTRCR